jgi:hypothetical protein
MNIIIQRYVVGKTRRFIPAGNPRRIPSMYSRIMRWTEEQWPLNSILFIFLLQIVTDILRVIYSVSKEEKIR